ncbi:hypothetical protein BDY21DRAFT_209939 [Lineolata rhizophorae]|uniref:Ras-GAP domain-containing protein n=1 Tax=Lineolata rhizophorae TaxID=578093 RepID=A0A6A6P3Y3_9PEZI|nr:hypothetical protein BDY21DRAFT_209939 [Lineolata rhizophorae]
MERERLPRRRPPAKSVSLDSHSSQTARDDPPVPPTRATYSTIRTVTPESMNENGKPRPQYPRPEDANTMASSPPVSPRTKVESPRAANPRAFLARAGSSEEQVLRSGKEAQMRPRTRTMDERSQERSTSSLFIKSRHRIGSVHSTSSASYGGLDDTVTSIGHPLTISPTPQTTPRPSAVGRNKLAKQQARADPSPLQQRVADPDAMISLTLPSNVRKTYQLMRSTCGVMSGMLAFRRGDSDRWRLSYCEINEEAGSLVYEPREDSTYHRTLIPDLRGCQVKVAYDAVSCTPYLEVSLHNSSLEVHLRPPTEEHFETWYAALLCWQPIRPKGIMNKMAKPQGPRRLIDSRRHSEVSLSKEAPIIKVGKMIFWDPDVPFGAFGNGANQFAGRTPSYSTHHNFRSRRWRKVSCTLRENGELKLYADTDVTLLAVVQLSQLSRCAVQRLDPSVLDNEFCIAVYPQYPSGADNVSLLRPIFVSLESRVLYEVWIVLLRAFTIPQLYGPKQALQEDLSSSQSFATVDMFRMERSLYVKVIEAKLLPPVSPHSTEPQPTPGSRPVSASAYHRNPGYYIEILLDSETRAKTTPKYEPTTPWWREEFKFSDLPATLATASIVLKKRPPRPPPHNHHTEGKLTKHESLESNELSGSYPTFDVTCGRADIYLDDLEPGADVEKSWALLSPQGHSIGEISLRIRTDDAVILMAMDYQPMSELLHRFTNGLTLQIAQILSSQLKDLSECLLDIFQVSGEAGEWIMSLVEEEIDGTLKETPVSRLRFSRRLGSTESGDAFSSTGERELIVRDYGKSAMLEANLLFRGNTLLTKALDMHMKRLGKEYLEETLGEKLKEINDKDPDCEVDPNKVRFHHDIERNWRRLITYTEEVWQCIYTSASRCPPELRVIFRHIRACAEDRYGDFLRTVTYSSVSGFLFLRFFCPAVLNPKLFGLLKDHPKDRARRTFTLIAKSLQGLANMSTFGAKETWMEPMNRFLSSHRDEFKTFVDGVCSISSDRAPSAIPPSYSTPLQILTRLPPTSREGFPSLPYLIDHARSFANLVNLWLEHAGDGAYNLQTSDGELLRFHNICEHLQARTRDCLERAERAEQPSSSLNMQWEELLREMTKDATLEAEEEVTAEEAEPRDSRTRAQSTSAPTSATSRGSGSISGSSPPPLEMAWRPKPLASSTAAAASAGSSPGAWPVSASASRTARALPKQRAHSPATSSSTTTAATTPTSRGPRDYSPSYPGGHAAGPSNNGEGMTPPSSATAMEGSTVLSDAGGSDAESTTALPRMDSRERDSSRGRGRLGGFVPSLAMGRGRRKKGKSKGDEMLSVGAEWEPGPSADGSGRPDGGVAGAAP